ncbi:MAG: hypothetical protein KDK39_02820 [Leptospiraceae bacterium]|nr:hypothetical protein [Leptospiraceae bacterium]
METQKHLYLDGSALVVLGMQSPPEWIDMILSDLRQEMQSQAIVLTTSPTGLESALRYLKQKRVLSDTELVHWQSLVLDLCHLMPVTTNILRRASLLQLACHLEYHLAIQAALVLEEGLARLYTAQPDWYASIPLLPVFRF